jgi:hypothetical protein
MNEQAMPWSADGGSEPWVETTREALRRFAELVRARPFSSLLAAFAAGFLVGRIAR